MQQPPSFVLECSVRSRSRMNLTLQDLLLPGSTQNGHPLWGGGPTERKAVQWTCPVCSSMLFELLKIRGSCGQDRLWAPVLPELHRIATVVGALWPSGLLLPGSGQLLGTIQSRFPCYPAFGHPTRPAAFRRVANELNNAHEKLAPPSNFWLFAYSLNRGDPQQELLA